jgi:hypothetical protein
LHLKIALKTAIVKNNSLFKSCDCDRNVFL